MWIKDDQILYGTIDSGRNVGLLAFKIDIIGNYPENGMEEVAKVINRIREYPSGAEKIVEIRGVYTQENENALFTFTKSMKDFGYRIVTISTGQSFRSWFQFVDYLRVEIGNDLWSGFKCNELVFLMENDGSPEPILPELIPAFTAYISPSKEVTAEGLFNFIRGSKTQWAILTRGKDLYHLRVGGEE
jgi:hypothetical protein